MAKKKGWVASISRDGWAKVITERGDACNNCEAAEFCHSIAECSKTAFISRSFMSKNQLTPVITHIIKRRTSLYG